MTPIEAKKLSEPPRLLWCVDYYDGPLSGVAVIDCKEVYFRCEDAGPDRRVFHAYEMTAEEWAEEQRMHDLFRAHVGTHFDYGDCEGGTCRMGEIRPQSEWHKFYDVAKGRAGWEPHGRAPVAWWEE